MSDDPAQPGEGADDLLDRWPVQHETPSNEGEAPRPRRVPSAARPSETATRGPVVELQAPVEAPVAPTSGQKRKIVAYDDMIALATMAALPVTEPEAEATELEPLVQPATPVPVLESAADLEPVVEYVEQAEPVLPGAVLTPPTPHPVLPEQQDDEVPPMSSVVVDPFADPATPGAPTVRRRVVTRGKARPEADEPKRRPLVARSTEPSTGDAARGMLAAARAATAVTETATRPPTRAPRQPAAIEPVSMLPATATAVAETTPITPPMEMPSVYEFAPLKGSRRLMSIMLVVGLAASAYLGYGAYLSRETVEIGIAGIVTFATLAIWGIRAGASVTRLTVRSGQLEIVRQGGRQVFDLTSHYTRIEVVGKPGTKKWKVLFVRPGMAPTFVDSTMVDGKDFMRILGFFRPDLVGVTKK